MAQKKLLFFVIISLLTTLKNSFVWALDEQEDGVGEEKKFEFSASDLEFASDIAKEGRVHTLSAIKAKLLEFKKMKNNLHLNNKESPLEEAHNMDNFENLSEAQTTLKVFVSTSMSKPLLKSYVAMAKKYDAVLIFNGLPEGSWEALSDLVFELTDNGLSETSMQIDDTAFEEYGIRKVPAIVLVREMSIFSETREENAPPVFDKITGNIGIRRALEEFSEKGALSEEANLILSKVEESS